VLHPKLILPTNNDVVSPSDENVDIDAMIKRFSEENGGQSNRNVFAEGVLASLGDDIHAECPICLDVMEGEMIIPECMHRW
jgi:hypothetical protein